MRLGSLHIPATCDLGEAWKSPLPACSGLFKARAQSLVPVARVYSCALLRWSSPLNNVERLKLRNIIHSVQRKHRLFNRFIMSSNSWKLFCEFWVRLVLIDFYQSFNWCFSVDWVIVLVVSLCIKSSESTSPMWPAVLMKDCVQKCQTQWQMVTKTTSRSLKWLSFTWAFTLYCILLHPVKTAYS